jgi:hypothetical protein
MAPWAQGPNGGFQSGPGTGASKPIEVTFRCPVRRVAVTIFDPDFDLNRIRAEDVIGATIDEVPFSFDGQPGRLTSERREVSGAGIKRVWLVPAPGDYVWWKDLTWE